MSLKIIVAYVSAGSGHRRAAEAIYNCLKKYLPESSINFVDVLEYANLLFANFYSYGYYLLVAHLRLIWIIGYHLNNFKYIGYFFNLISRLNCRRFTNLLLKEQPDVILTSHFLPTAVAAYLKRKGKINSRLITVVTDFGLHSLWVYKNCDDYIVASDYTLELLAKRSINKDKIKILGIPISSEFSNAYQGRSRKERLTALLVTGSFGFYLIENVVNMLYSEMDLIVVCGNNHGLYERLKRKRYTSVRLFGFTEDMPSLMSQADLIITKAGGMTISEALAMRLPMVFIGCIPGQETENARILASYDCGIEAKNLEFLKNIIINLKTNPERLASMRANIDKFKKPNAAEEICRYVLKDVRSGSI